MARKLSIEQLDPYNGGAFKSMRLNRLAMTGECPVTSPEQAKTLPVAPMTEPAINDPIWRTL